MTAMDDPALQARAIRLVTNPGGGGTVEVDGRDLTSAVRGFTLTASGREVPQLLLELTPWYDPTVVEGFAQVVIGVDPPGSEPGEAAAMFLQALDPVALEQAVLAAPLPTGPGGTMRAALDVLTAWAEGRTP